MGQSEPTSTFPKNAGIGAPERVTPIERGDHAALVVLPAVDRLPLGLEQQPSAPGVVRTGPGGGRVLVDHLVADAQLQAGLLEELFLPLEVALGDEPTEQRVRPGEAGGQVHLDVGGAADQPPACGVARSVRRLVGGRGFVLRSLGTGLDRDARRRDDREQPGEEDLPHAIPPRRGPGRKPFRPPPGLRGSQWTAVSDRFGRPTRASS